MGKFDGKLLITDMDNTLLNSNREVSEKNRNAIKYFTSEGGKFGVASGRGVDAVRGYKDIIGINIPAVMYNGAMVYSFDTETAVYRMDIEEERKKNVKKIFDTRPDLGIEIYADEHIYVLRKCFATSRFLTKNYDVTYHMPNEIWNVPWTKVLVIGTEKQLDDFEPIYRREYDSGNAVRSEKNFFDIVANGVSKGYGVTKLAEMLNIDSGNIYVVGDNMNDVEMIECAAHGYAVENSVEALKIRAERVVPSNDNDAIAYIIDNLVG